MLMGNEKMMGDMGTALRSQVFKDSFSAFDCVSGEWFYSKDYESLAEFFARFDNVQFIISNHQHAEIQQNCDKCGCMDVFLRKKNNATGLYCGGCGKWYKWLKKKDVKAYGRRGFNVHPENYDPKVTEASS